MSLDVQGIWNDYRAELHGFLVSRVQRPEDADDLLQEVMVKTHKNLDSIQDSTKLRSWLYQVTRNAVIDHYRRSARDPEPEPAYQSFEPHEQVLQDLAACVRPFVSRLPDPYREVLEAVELEGKSQKEVARSLGVPYSTVKSRVQRGRQKLAQLFHDCCLYELDARGNVIGYQSRSSCGSC